MKNHQYIRQLSVKELAKLLVKEVEVNEGDYDWDYDDEPNDYYVTRYYSPDGKYSYGYDEALQATMDWLNAERKEK